MANVPAGGPDLDLLEYVLVTARDADGLAPVVAAVVELVRVGSIRLLDAVVLVRDGGTTLVTSHAPTDPGLVAALEEASEGGVLLSGHDVELASVSLGPDEMALLLLVEDRWAGVLSDAARVGGARLTAGERIAPDRALASLTQAGTTDLIVRGPGAAPLTDQVAQVRELAHLVERGLLSLDRYDVQRRRVLGT
ncbi:hypothetical protein [Cellulomonas edaphi]|uniref:Uncharacterized protein n=1 Tax=Cellulomonas edaphi TaxID=3053468 RepID=A0ABT7S596_9CELL|nr:hypothetical protein [Cellulomons edaphi]MDM7830787.1 hypothetical protein [Cellulomons edaphi]